MHKRGSEEGLSSLIGLVLVVLFLVPVGIYGYALFKEKNRLAGSIDFLAENISKLESGKDKSMLLYTGPPNDYTLIGFDTGKNDFGTDGLWSCSLDNSIYLSFFGKIKKPGRCGNKPCICFCEISSTNFKGACESSSAICETVNVNYELKFTSNDNECEYGLFLISNREVTNIKLQRHENLVGVCTQGDCINLNRQKAIDAYNHFIDTYRQCIADEKNKCLCDTFDVSTLPEGYKVRIASSNGVTKVGLLSEEKRLATTTFEDNYLCKYSGTDDTRDIPLLEFSKDVPTDYADGNLINFYKKTKQVTCVAEKKDDSFNYLLQNQPCSSPTIVTEDDSVSLT